MPPNHAGQTTPDTTLIEILRAINQIEFDIIPIHLHLAKINEILNQHLPNGEVSLSTENFAGDSYQPIHINEKTIGWLIVSTTSANQFSASQLDILQEQIALTLQKAKRLHEMSRLSTIANTFRQISLEITSTLDQHEVLQRVLRHLKDIVNYDAASIWLFNEKGQTYFVLGEGHEDFGVDPDPSFHFDLETTPVLQEIVHTKKPIIVPNVHEYALWTFVEGYEWLNSWATAPIIIYDEVIGHLSLDHSQPNFYTEADSDILQELARLLSIAVKNARLYESLHRREAQSTAMLNAIPDQMFRLHQDGTILDYKVPEGHPLLIHPEDIIGESVEAFWEQSTAHDLYDCIQHTLDTQQVQIYEYQYRTAAELVFYEVRMAVCGDAEVMAMVRNITERREARLALEKSEERYRKIIEDAGDAIFTLNAQGEFTYVNPRLKKITGYDDNILGLSYSDFVMPEWKSRIEHFFEGTPRRRIPETTLEIPLIAADGNLMWTEQKITLFLDDNQHVTGSQSILRDVTVRKRFETELKKAKEGAEIANLAKSRFLANMSHELRTPLNAILGFTQLMLRDQQLEAEQKENARTIFRSGQHLLMLITDVLEMSKIEAGHVTLTENEFDLYRLLDDMKDMFSLRAERSGLDLLTAWDDNLPQYILADEGKLRQIIINLLSNAIKFTEQGSVKLEVTPSPLTETSRVQLHFNIQDTGKGIPPDEIDTLFNPFVQSTTNQVSHEGTGLGLAITKQFVEMMDGEISAESEVGVGSKFYFTIDIMTVEAIDVQPTPERRRVMGLAPNQPTYRILVVEDRFENRNLLVRLLKAIGFSVREAENGQEGIEIWQEWQPHLIWMDMRMPVMDGFAATQHIKRTEQGKNTIVISLTASVFDFEQEAIYEAGCDDYVAKPFREYEIFDKMRVYLGVNYIYDDHDVDAPDQTQELVVSDLEALSLTTIENLYEACVQVDRERINNILSSLGTEHQQLVQQLTQLVRNYRFDKIITLIESMARNSSR